MELLDLRVFVRVADLESVSGAARVLGMPKSSVSRALTRLEGEVGLGLVERSTRGLRLTDAGRLLQRYARRILDDVDEAHDALAGLAGEPRGDLRVSAPFTLAVGPIATMLPSFGQRYPLVRVALEVENRVVDLVGEAYDVAVRIGPLPDSPLIARRLARINMWLCTSPSYLDASEPLATPADLQRHRLISYGTGADPWRFRHTGGALANLDLDLEAWLAVREPDAVLGIVAGGGGVALLPDFTAAPALADGRLVRVLPQFAMGALDVHAVYPRQRSLSSKVRVFIDHLARQIHPEI